MSLICAISNEVPEHPVVSPVSGCIYERRLIEKYITENATDPFNGEKLEIEQLVDLKADAFGRRGENKVGRFRTRGV
ncbi:Pre-mRNA-processing factor 19 [Lamellibrachia satsuma]|nr:Pre-mRNA-processing factor 19 [Lamellibrachia satsuma]